MPKTNKMFSLDVDLCKALADKAAAECLTMTSLIEAGLRHVLALPPLEREETLESATRTERAMLEELRRAGPGWHSSVELSLAVGVSHHVGQKALKALGRQGAAIAWGDARRFSNDSHGGTCWGTEPAMDLVRRLVKTWKEKDGKDDMRLIYAIRKLGQGMSDVADARALIAEVTRLNPGELMIENFAELAERRRRELRAENERDAAEAVKAPSRDPEPASTPNTGRLVSP